MQPGSSDRPLRVAIIGSGPSGFYAAAALLKNKEHTVRVDMFDRLPTPFGLVRGGVAPDHQKIKNVIRVYNKTAAMEGFRYYGNVRIGSDLSVEELQAHYDQIVFAVGNESDRKMGIPGEDLKGVHSATEFVGWYNGHPDFQDLTFDLAGASRVAVVGNGNVAMDVTRILAADPDELAKTDITDEALLALRKSKVNSVVLLGRRGPAQAAFSPKEIKEIGALETADLVIDKAEVTLDPLSAEWLENEAAPSAKKNVAYLEEAANASSEGAPGNCQILCRFLVSPTEFLGEDGKLNQVRIEKNELQADDKGTPRPRGTGETELLDVDLVFKAVGYRGTPLPGVPFDDRWGTFPNSEGRITGDSGDAMKGLYVVGWAKRGPSGLIGTNGPDSQATVAKMIEDLEAGRVDAASSDADAVDALLRDKQVDVVTWEDWQRLDQDEIERGEKAGKVREKYTNVDSMMAAVRRLRG